MGYDDENNGTAEYDGEDSTTVLTAGMNNNNNSNNSNNGNTGTTVNQYSVNLADMNEGFAGQSGYGTQNSGFVNQSNYGNQTEGFMNQSNYGNQTEGFMNQSNYGNQTEGFMNQSNYGNQTEGFMNQNNYGAQTGYGAQNGGYPGGGYNGAANGYNNYYGNQGYNNYNDPQKGFAGQPGYGAPDNFGSRNDFGTPDNFNAQNYPEAGKSGEGKKASKAEKKAAGKALKASVNNGNGGKSHKKTGLIVTLVVVVLLLAAAAGAYFMFFTPEKRLDRAMENAKKAMKEQRYDDAEKYYRDALDIDDKNMEAVNGCMDALIKAKKNEDAKAQYAKFREEIKKYSEKDVKSRGEQLDEFYAKAGDMYEEGSDEYVTIVEEGYDIIGSDAIRDELVVAYIKNADDYVTYTDYDARIEVYNKALALAPDNKDALDNRAGCVRDALEGMINNGDYDGAEAFIDRYRDVVTGVDYDIYESQIETFRKNQAMIKETMENAESYMADRDYESMLSIDNSEGAELIYSTMQGDQYIYADDEDTTDYTGTAVALCRLDDGYYFYYGSFENGERSGEGNCFVSTGDSTYRAYEGSWSGGDPNGAGKTIECAISDGGGEAYTCYYTGNLVNGLFDGTVSASLEAGGSTYTGSFTASNGAVSDVSDNYPNYTFGGIYSKIYVVMENGTSQCWYDGFEDGDKIGVLGYGK
ncbi:tetratricopeptide repeat protein [Coprococcus sp. OM04-5BH]|uniref:tetratricopeptide repeat protein n=1 Tax=Coprococcus sp. OM04-5BH TaxID=2293093 RepID=UPI000E497886|nr:tetratricopeptide repeat protein [Coprococcus sp. OM04-5BH]RHV30996.1 tetratricopeptide repeat protein [Coprococcus sp. OM04-5BH]